MNRKLVTQIGLVAVSIALAAMGCWFCWNCPMNWLYGEGRHSVFMRQVVWNAMGLVFLAGASMVRWKWWQKSEPWRGQCELGDLEEGPSRRLPLPWHVLLR